MTSFRAQWITDGFPWCDICGQPAVFSETHGNLHSTPERRFGLYPDQDPADHRPTFQQWADEGRRRRTAL